MSFQLAGIIFGGLLPAVFFGVCGVFNKASSIHGISTSAFLLANGLAVTIFALVLAVVNKGSRGLTLFKLDSAFGFALLSGTSLAAGITFLIIGLNYYKLPMSVAAPLHNTNALVAVCLCLWIFSEWKDTNLPVLFSGALLVVAGVTLVALSRTS